ncbi:MAG TPA: hypothetical protein VNT02_02455 [Burkholderiales bacterium]|nr:hypothetical protein [Burkholderiales bacterium]
MEHVKQFISWVGGAVAGLSILFYAAGYLVYRAHVNMLGLTGIVDYPHEQLLYEGAKFYFTVCAYLLKTFFVVGITVLLLVILGMLLRHIGWLDRAIGRAGTSLRARIATWNARRPALLRAVVLALLALLFVLHTDRFFYPLEDLYTGIENLLYTKPAAEFAPRCTVGSAPGERPDDMVSAVTTWLQQGERCRPQLLGEFRRLLAGYLLLLVAGYFALTYRELRHTAVYRAGTVTLVVYGVLYTLLLPVAFGVLVRSPVYPYVVVKKDGAGVASSARHLLHRQENALLVWDPAARKATWMRADTAVVEIDVLGQANLFSRIRQDGMP